MEHVIKNFDKLATSSQRKTVLKIAEAGLRAIQTGPAVRRAVKYNQKKEILEVEGYRYGLKEFERVICIGFGKAALDAVAELQKILNNKVSCGFVIDLKEGGLGNITCRVGTHPLPSQVNIKATKELLALLSGCTERDLVLCVVSGGGGSSLLCYPNEMTCEAEVAIIAALTVKGANIQELNTVRKHISRVKGGNLAKLMYPAQVISLIFSDVPGDNLGMVASGPTVPDTTTIKDASEVLKKYDILEYCKMPACRLAETPKEQKYFDNVQNVLVVSARQALNAMREEAETLGYDVGIFSDHYQGIARELAGQIAVAGKPGQVLLGAGESTVHIIGEGLGGRNQEMALAALEFLGDKQVLACVASDGHDNTDSAGAIADAGTVKRAQALHLDPRAYLDNNDSFHFFEQVGDQILTGLTGSNVSDFFISLKH